MAYNKYAKVRYGLMPKSFHEGDKQWINEQLGYLNKADRERICAAYTKAFDEAALKQPIEYMKDGTARKAANRRLRVFIEKRFRVFNG